MYISNFKSAPSGGLLRPKPEHGPLHCRLASLSVRPQSCDEGNRTSAPEWSAPCDQGGARRTHQVLNYDRLQTMSCFFFMKQNNCETYDLLLEEKFAELPELIRGRPLSCLSANLQCLVQFWGLTLRLARRQCSGPCSGVGRRRPPECAD